MNNVNETDSAPNITLTIIMICVILISLFLNSLVISSICCLNNTKWTVFMKTKLALVLSDIGIVFSALPVIAYRLLSRTGERLPWYTILGNVEVGLSVISLSSSLNTLAVMALQRLYAIREPFKYLEISGRRQNAILVSVWVPGFVYASLFLLYEHLKFSQTYIIVVCSLSLLMPYFVMVSSTVAMMMAFLQDRNVPTTANNTVTIRRRHDHSKVVKITVLMALSYSVACVPQVVFHLIYLSQGIQIS